MSAASALFFFLSIHLFIISELILTFKKKKHIPLNQMSCPQLTFKHPVTIHLIKDLQLALTNLQAPTRSSPYRKHGGEENKR